HGRYQWTAHALHVLEQFRVPSDGLVLRVAAHTLAVESDCHLAEPRVSVDVFFHSHAVPPLPSADAADAIIRGAAVAVVSDVVGEDVVPCLGQVLVLNNEIDLDALVIAPWLPEMPWKTCTAHGQRVIEDDEFVALAALGGDVPGFEGDSVLRRDKEVVPI